MKTFDPFPSLAVFRQYDKHGWPNNNIPATDRVYRSQAEQEAGIAAMVADGWTLDSLLSGVSLEAR